MFFEENQLSLELMGVFKIERGQFRLKSFPKRGYDSLSLRLMGSGQFKTEEKTVTVKAGDVLYIPKTADYSQQTSSETIIAIHFINYTYSKSNRIEVLHGEDTEKITALFLEMYTVWKEKKQGYRLRCTSLLYELLYLLNGQTQSRLWEQSGAGRIKRAVNYIHENFRAETVEVAKLAAMCSFSETYFRKLFKKFYDVSPKQYALNLKMEYAAQLLQSRLYSVAQVSERCGFSDVKYFSRLFKERFGCTPREYRSLDGADVRVK